ncbi:hypothetical protein ATY76_31590 [Rhizobium sp. R339]|nr:hypothetical protein ATY76_31590 [Rhizobium sp. R339]
MILFLRFVRAAPIAASMAVYGPGAIDAAPFGPERSGGRVGAAFLDREECEHSSQGKKVADGRCGMAIETKGALRSHQIHRGLRGCARTSDGKGDIMARFHPRR